MQLAIQTYELVDKHIRRLDSDLARFESEIQDKALNSRTTEDLQSKSMYHFPAHILIIKLEKVTF